VNVPHEVREGTTVPGAVPGDDTKRVGAEQGPVRLSEEEKRAVRKQFAAVANMPPGKLERWLTTVESKAVGERDDGVSHRAGERIVELKRTKMDDLVETDYAQMQEIGRYLERRLARRPKDPVRLRHWRHTVMNWGHDPLT
jgi:hypothetical protein